MHTERVKNFFRNNLGIILVIIASIGYILLGFIEIGETGKSIGQIIADGMLALIFGLVINMLLSFQGILTGERDEKVIATNNTHAEITLSIENETNYLEEFCVEATYKELKKRRTMILINVGIKYDDIFDEEFGVKDFSGLIKEDDKLKKIKMNAIKKAIKYKLTPLTPQSLTANAERQDDVYNFGKSKTTYIKSKFTKKLASKLLFSVIFGYFGVSMASNFTIANLIWTTIQVLVFILFGGVSYFQAFMFITDEDRRNTVNKIDVLTTFKSWVRDKLEVKNKQDLGLVKGVENDVNNERRTEE